MAEPDELPVSLALHARIETRCGWYEQNQSYLFPHEKTREVNYGPFSQEGLNIAQAIKAELPEWTVIYFDEAAYQETAENGKRTLMATINGYISQVTPLMFETEEGQRMASACIAYGGWDHMNKTLTPICR